MKSICGYCHSTEFVEAQETYDGENGESLNGKVSRCQNCGEVKSTLHIGVIEEAALGEGEK